ncbi:hypothetical protein F5I97DRAFT_2021313, partial [Phlebopus sp. FC_14]
SRYTTINFVARPAEREAIDAIVAERQPQITHLTLSQKLYGVQAKLDALQAELRERKSRVQESSKFHRTLTSAIRRLPPEILGEIFLYCLPEYPYITQCHRYTPLVLTWVCQRWRSIAMATPQLWSSLAMTLHKTTKADYRLQCETWLARAKDIPLILSIRSSGSIDRTLCPLGWLRSLVARCRDLHWGGALLEGLFTDSSAFDLLQRLDLNVSFAFTFRGIDIPSNANKLRSVRLSVPYDVASLDGIALPWAQLTKIEINGPGLPVAGILRLLEICPRLHNARFFMPNKPRNSAVTPAINHSLKLLDIRLRKAGQAKLLFDASVFPSLEKLDIWFSYCEVEEWPHAEFTSFVTRSGCSLRMMTVFNNQSAGGHQLEYQALLPSCTFKL